MGIGEWLRGQTEHGKPVFLHGSHTTVVEAARREFYLIVDATSPGSKLELFCRRKRPELQSYGNKIGKLTLVERRRVTISTSE